jgi:hypothetical protein
MNEPSDRALPTDIRVHSHDSWASSISRIPSYFRVVRGQYSEPFHAFPFRVVCVLADVASLGNVVSLTIDIRAHSRDSRASSISPGPFLLPCPPVYEDVASLGTRGQYSEAFSAFPISCGSCIG